MKSFKLLWISVAVLSVLVAVVFVLFFDDGADNKNVQENAKPDVYVTEAYYAGHGPDSLSLQILSTEVNSRTKVPETTYFTKNGLISPSTVYIRVANRGQSSQSYTQIELDDVATGQNITVFSQKNPHEHKSFEVSRVEIDE